MDTRFLAGLTFSLLLTATGASAEFRNLWQKDKTNLLTADQAFALQPVTQQGKTLHAQWNIAPGYYLYRSRIQLEAVEPAAKLGNASLPKGEVIRDPHFGEVEIYRAGTVTADMPVSGAIHQIKIRYQGCAEAGVCYPPQTRVVAVQKLP